MANSDLRTESVPDNLIPFPTPTARLRADVPPFDPSNPNHLRAWEAIWDCGQAELRRKMRDGGVE